MILRLSLLAGAVMVCLGIVTQIMLPAYHGRPFFPMFDTKRRKAKRKLEEARAAEVEAALLTEAERIRVSTTELEVEAHEEAQERLDNLIDRQEGKR